MKKIEKSENATQLYDKKIVKDRDISFKNRTKQLHDNIF